MTVSLKERLAQWAEFNRQKEEEAVSNPVSPQEAVRWAGEVLDLVIARDGLLEREPDDYTGIRVMHERLANISLNK